MEASDGGKCSCKVVTDYVSSIYATTPARRSSFTLWFAN